MNGGAYQSSNTFTGLGNGTYSVTVKDSNGCTATSSSTTFAVTAPNATFTVQNVSCNGGSDGAIIVSGGSGGSGTGYQASIDNLNYYPISATQQKTFGSLSPNGGPYTIFIKDSNGCYDGNGYTFNITQPSAQTCTISVYSYDSGSGNGQISVTVAGGTGVKTLRLYEDTSLPYSDYSTDVLVQTATGVANSTTYTFTNVPCKSTDYWVQVTDANGCVIHSSSSVTVCGYNPITAVKIGNNLTCIPSGSSTVYLLTPDYNNYVAAGNQLGVGMTIYSGAGVLTTYNSIYDINFTTIWSINTSGVITGVKPGGNC